MISSAACRNFDGLTEQEQTEKTEAAYGWRSIQILFLRSLCFLLLKSGSTHVLFPAMTIIEAHKLLERITVQRVVATWLHAQYIDRACMSADAAGGIASFWSKRQVMAEKRYVLALKALELVHKMQAASQSRQKPEACAAKPSTRRKQPRRSSAATRA